MGLAIWGARARQQCHAVSELQHSGAVILYDYELQDDSASPESPIWSSLRTQLGRDWFHDVVAISFVNNWRGATDEDMIWIAHLQKLRSVTAMRTAPRMKYECRVSDVGLQRLSQLRELETLQLNGASITDAGLCHINSLNHLETLWLEDTRVTNAGLTNLNELSSLKELVLYNTSTTHAGIESARRDHPARMIYWTAQ
jgi:hypothetical protein